MATAYVYLATAIIFEVLGTITMKYSEGFTKVIPVILTVVCHGICFVALAMALKSLPISIVYAIWAGVGTAIMAVLGQLFFNEPLHFQKVLATSLIILGVVMLNVNEESEPVPQVKLAKSQNQSISEPTSQPTSEELLRLKAVIKQRNSG